MGNPIRAGARIAAIAVATAVLSGAACQGVQSPATAEARRRATEQDTLLADLRALPVRTDPKDPAVDRLRRRFETLYLALPAAAREAPDIVREERELRGKIVLDALEHAATLDSADALATVATDEHAASGARQYALECLRSSGHAPAVAAEAAPAEHARSVARR